MSAAYPLYYYIDDSALLTFAGIVRFLKQLYLLAYGFIEGTMAVLWAACPFDWPCTRWKEQK